MKYCELTVCYERCRACNRDKRWIGRSAENYKAHFIYAKELGTDQSIGTGAVKEVISEEYDRLIISGYLSPSVILAIIYCRSHRIPHIIESDGRFNSAGPFIKRWVKNIFFAAPGCHLLRVMSMRAIFKGWAFQKMKFSSILFRLYPVIVLWPNQLLITNVRNYGRIWELEKAG